MSNNSSDLNMYEMLRMVEDEADGPRHYFDMIIRESKSWDRVDSKALKKVGLMPHAVARLSLDEIDQWVNVLIRLSACDGNEVPISESRTIHYLNLAGAACLLRNESFLPGLLQRLDPKELSVGNFEGQRYFTRQYQRLGLIVKLINNQISARSIRRLQLLFTRWTPNEAFSDFLCEKVRSATTENTQLRVERNRGINMKLETD